MQVTVARMRWTAAVVGVALLMAGCLGANDEEGRDGRTDGPGDGASDGSGRADALRTNGTSEVPAWEVGMYWTFEGSWGPTTLVVTGETVSDWFVDVTDDEAAFMNAREDVSTIGEQRKSDLAGSQGPTRVKFFDWPLDDGKTWTTTWDGETRRITASRDAEGRFHMVARAGDAVRVEYTYDPDVRWFSALTFYGEDGSQFWSGRLTEHGTDFRGDVVRYRVQNPVTLETDSPALPLSGQWEVAADITDVWLWQSRRCEGQGAIVLRVEHAEKPQEPKIDRHTVCPTDGEEEEATVLPPDPGTWDARLQILGGPVEVHSAFTVFLRTRITMPVGPPQG